MSLFEKIRDFVRAEDEYDEFDDEDYGEPEPRPEYRPNVRKTYGLPTGTETLSPRREPLREPLARERERENVIPLRGSEALRRLTEKFKIVVTDPKTFDECPKFVDDLKNRTPVIINLEFIENDTARKVFDFLSGATYALNGNVQKIAQNIFVFTPENVNVQTGSDHQDSRYGDEKASPWR